MDEWKQQLAQVEQRLASLPPQLELVAQQQRNKQEITELKKKGSSCFQTIFPFTRFQTVLSRERRVGNHQIIT
jgi:hypothetical protein